jgi:hypothetical protein
MYRSLVMFPSSVAASEVERIRDEEILPAFRKVEGFLGLAASVGPLMGPSARAGTTGHIIIVEFDSLDAALGAIQSEAFAKGYAETEAMGVEVYLFEVATF